MAKHNQTLNFVTFSALALSIGMASPAFAESVEHYVDDATITAKVKEAILADSQLKVMEVKVDTNHGIVQLSGAVDTKAQESEAVKVAGQIDGVKSVTDNLSVKVVNAE
jgi:hyperosmotically inducible protein